MQLSYNGTFQTDGTVEEYRIVERTTDDSSGMKRVKVATAKDGSVIIEGVTNRKHEPSADTKRATDVCQVGLGKVKAAVAFDPSTVPGDEYFTLSLATGGKAEPAGSGEQAIGKVLGGPYAADDVMDVWIFAQKPVLP